MRRFTKKIVFPFIQKSGYRDFCEIGSQGGSNLDQLLCVSPNIHITTIDPCVDENLEQKYADDSRVVVRKGLGLEVLHDLENAFDCIMIDGDHNWYSVYNELKIIHQRELLNYKGAILLHDVHWPYARRDLYYNPSTIPAEFLHPHAKRGMIRGRSALSDSPGSGKNPDLYNALHEGGPRNGVLTAVEDFLAEYPGEYQFFRIHREWGLGVITRTGEAPGGLRWLKMLSWVYGVVSPVKLWLGIYDK